MPHKDPEAGRKYKAEYRARPENRERARKYMQAYQKANRAQLNVNAKAYYHRHKDRCRAAVKAYHAKNPGLIRKWQLKHRYGLTLEQYDSMLEGQDYRCAICRTNRPGGRGDWHVDHCHSTGVVRGILCARCNRVLGGIGDTVDAAMKYIRYLEKSGGQTN